MNGWDESQHPRDEQGRFGEGGGEGGGEGEGGGVAVSGGGANKAAVQAAVNAIPKEHLKNAGIASVTVQATIVNQNGQQIAGLARRYGSGPTEIMVANSVNGKALKDPTGTATHEIGHAIDNASGLRLSRSMAPTIHADANKLSAADKYLAQHYLSNDRELFAELYKLKYSPSKKGAFGMGQKTAEKKFAKSLAAMI